MLFHELGQHLVLPPQLLLQFLGALLELLRLTRFRRLAVEDLAAKPTKKGRRK